MREMKDKIEEGQTNLPPPLLYLGLGATQVSTPVPACFHHDYVVSSIDKAVVMIVCKDTRYKQ
jgi:hypothetical protein